MNKKKNIAKKWWQSFDFIFEGKIIREMPKFFGNSHERRIIKREAERWMPLSIDETAQLHFYKWSAK